jgi:hypothetical protein
MCFFLTVPRGPFHFTSMCLSDITIYLFPYFSPLASYILYTPTFPRLSQQFFFVIFIV